MTREEVKRIATGLRTDFKCESETMVDFCNTVIKALEQEPCEDAISRQAVLEFLKGFEILHNHDELRSNLIYGIMNLPSVTPQPKTGHWIPVSERLPEEETDVLICNRNGDIALSRGSYSTEVENDFIWYTSGWRFGKVIAWMPLPKPYKAESEE